MGKIDGSVGEEDGVPDIVDGDVVLGVTSPWIAPDYTLTGLWWETEIGAYWTEFYPFVYEYGRGWEYIFEPATAGLYWGYSYGLGQFFLYFPLDRFDANENGYAGVPFWSTDGITWTLQEFEGVWYQIDPVP